MIYKSFADFVIPKWYLNSNPSVNSAELPIGLKFEINMVYDEAFLKSFKNNRKLATNFIDEVSVKAFETFNIDYNRLPFLKWSKTINFKNTSIRYYLIGDSLDFVLQDFLLWKIFLIWNSSFPFRIIVKMYSIDSLTLVFFHFSKPCFRKLVVLSSRTNNERG